MVALRYAVTDFEGRTHMSAHSRFIVARLAGVAALTGGVLALAISMRAQQSGVHPAAHQPRGNFVTQWNAVATDAFTPSQGTNPMAQSRSLAIFHAAIHDALNAIDRRFASYTPGLAEPRRRRP
jgi:hypothetical protein